jgi:nitroreductase
MTGLDMSLQEAMSTQRAVRRIKPDPVDDALVLRLIELAQKAPTQQDTQGVGVHRREGRGREGAPRAAEPPHVAALPAGGRRKARDDPKTERMNAPSSGASTTSRRSPSSSSPASARRGSRSRRSSPRATSARSSRRSRTCLLAARAAGSARRSSRCRSGATSAARRILGLPWSITPIALVPLGWPIGRYGPTTRRPVGEVVSLDRYGNRPWRAR